MKERPILFSSEMVRAILDGCKSQTRRAIKGDSGKCPYGEAGDSLWVREAAYISPPCWCSRSDASHLDTNGEARMVDYAATMDSDAVRAAEEYGIKKSPSIHMPRWASRIMLKITYVTTQRLQDISEDEAAAEGIPRHDGPYILDFARLWDSINAKRGYSWNSNPRVWVVKFERKEPTT